MPINTISICGSFIVIIYRIDFYIKLIQVEISTNTK